MSGGSDPAYLLIYVEDLLVIGSKSAVSKTNSNLFKTFTTTEPVPCTHFLGLSIDRTSKLIVLSQQAFSENLVELPELTSAKPVPIPLPLSRSLYKRREPLTNAEQEKIRHVPYRSMLESFLYLAARSRLDISAAVSMLANYRGMSAPEHWKAMMHVVKYIEGTIALGNLLPVKDRTIRLEVCSDANWTRDQSNRRSRTGTLISTSGAHVV